MKLDLNADQYDGLFFFPFAVNFEVWLCLNISGWKVLTFSFIIFIVRVWLGFIWLSYSITSTIYVGWGRRDVFSILNFKGLRHNSKMRACVLKIDKLSDVWSIDQ